MSLTLAPLSPKPINRTGEWPDLGVCRAGIDISVPVPLQCRHSMRGPSPLSRKKSMPGGYDPRTPRHISHSDAPRENASPALLAGMIVAAFLALACSSGEQDPLGEDPREIQVPLEDATELIRAQQYEAAIEALGPHVSVPDPSTQALVLYGRSLIGARRSSLAIWSLQRAVEREDAPPRAPRFYAQALLAGGEDLAAIDYATHHLEEVDPEDYHMVDIRAQAFEVAMDLESAVDDLEVLAAESPGNARVIERLLNLLIQIEDWDGARERIVDLETLLERPGVQQETRTIHCATAARFEISRQEMEAAEAWLDKCLERYPLDTNLVFAREELLDATDRSDEATEYLERLARENPKRQVLRQGYASRLMRLGRVEESEAVLVESAEVDDHVNSWLALANMRLALNDLEGTAAALDEGIRAAMEMPADDPDLDWDRMLPESRFGIADVYVRAGHFDRAERIAASLDDEEPSMAALLRARAMLEQGDPQGALDAYQEAFRTFASNPAARYLAGRAAVEVGEFDLAVDLYQDALRADPTATDAGLVLAQMLMAEGRVNWALDSLTFLVARAGNEPFSLRLMARAGAAGAQHQFAEGVRAELAKNLDWAGIALADQARDIALIASPAEAREYLGQSDKLFEPSHFEALWMWVSLARGTADEEAARARVARFVADHADSFEAAMIEGRLHAADENLDAAIEALRRAVGLRPFDATAQAEFGTVLVEAERIEEGVEALDRAADLEPRDARPAFLAARTLHDADRLDEAEARYRALIIPHAWHGTAALMLVDLLRSRGDTTSDEVHLLAQRAARYHVVAGPRAFYELGRVELDRGAAEEALAQFEAALRGYRPAADVRLGMARAMARLGREEEARRQLELALQSSELSEPAAARALLESLNAQEAEG